ncbi:hypothetical protein [Paenibacillus sp. ISL-20]|uniref:hypothetical protein n=1 Tax=Paenibacillus sp. ISL-20 TaxID=2819163 RepID=UPI001BEB8E5F|nr:hypothetical protein [Paenibacillus sp. ISL-20]MBT2759933.1 hypothetical protein [Paenibacillus sp. ISL-20]
MNLGKIKPKVKGESNKYSWNLYKFLSKIVKKNEYIDSQLRIYWNHHSRWDGEHLPFNTDLSNGMQIIIDPYGNKSSGYFMNTVLRKGNCELYSLCVWKKEDLLDITDWFFDEYEKIGRCIFDPDHNGWMLGTDGRYTYVNNTRKCNWCGQWHHREIVKKVKIERISVWE